MDCEAITKVDEEFFTAMRNNSKQGFSVAGSYTEDLFYIAPIYHKAFPNLTRIIFLDSKDLEFRSDIRLLDEQVSQDWGSIFIVITIHHIIDVKIEEILYYLLMGIRDKKIPGRILSKNAGSRVSQWVIKNKMGKNR